MMRMFNVSVYRTILGMILLYSIFNVIEKVNGRFLWDLSSYCINYCSRINDQMPPIGVCSCHRITSYYRRMASNNPQLTSEQD